MTFIVGGTLDTLPAEVLRNLVELARRDGERLVIITMAMIWRRLLLVSPHDAGCCQRCR